MTVDPALVSPATRLAEVARLLLDESKPCVIVVDGQRQPIGIVPRSDILAAATRTDYRAGGQNRVGEASPNRRIRPGEQAPTCGQAQPCS
jgi:predicted transcriptional regulator